MASELLYIYIQTAHLKAVLWIQIFFLDPELFVSDPDQARKKEQIKRFCIKMFENNFFPIVKKKMAYTLYSTSLQKFGF